MTDAYFVFWLPPAGAPYQAPFDVEQVRALHPQQRWPHHRHYTVRRWDGQRHELTVDVVVHGDQGVAGPWAVTARPGDRVMITGANGAYRPDPSADWHLFVADESALPATAAALEAVPAHSHSVVIAVCDSAEHELPLPSPAPTDIRWLHRRGDPSDARLLVEAVRDLDWPPGRVHAFVHGEAGEIREVRRHLLAERGLPKADLSVSGYWRRTMTDEQWRQIKKDWNASVAGDVPE